MVCIRQLTLAFGTPIRIVQLYKLLHFGFEPHPSLYVIGRYYTIDRKRKNARVEGREDGIHYWEFIEYER